LDDLVQLFMQERFAAGHDDDWGAALVDRRQCVGDRNAFVEDWVGIVDLATTRASEVASEQWLQHQDERVALATGEMLPDDISANSRNLSEGYAHARSLQSQVDEMARQLNP
jgi:hypothetical protein